FFLSRWFPYPPSNGSKLRIFNLLTGLAQQHTIDLIAFAEEPAATLALEPLQQICDRVQVVPWHEFKNGSQAARLGYFKATPRYYLDTYSPAMQAQIQNAMAENAYDLVIASQIDMAVYGHCFGNVPAIFEEAEVGTLYEQYVNAPSWAQRLRFGLTWRKHRRYLQSLMPHYAACTVVSAPEQKILHDALGEQMADAGPEIVVIPNGVDAASYAAHFAMPKVDTLIFTGSFTYAPNYEAMCWFVAKVLPLIHAVRPAVRLVITGRHGQHLLPAADNVWLTGFVEDVRPLVAEAWVSLAPLHTGGGTRLKILEAMALRTPVVATTKGAEGLDAAAGQHLLIADSPADFAQAVLSLLQSESLRQELAQNAHELVYEKYDWGVIMPRFSELVEKVAGHE
ncbi:MAG: glycosyltransferase, partial [Caldilineaceae bacterium]